MGITDGETKTNSKATFSYGLQRIDVLVDQQKPYIYLLCTNIECSLEDLPGEIEDRDG